MRKSRTDEDIIGLGTGTSNLKEFHQVEKLAVYVTANLGWNISWLYVKFGRQLPTVTGASTT
jgi:hypothetical protein